jgi:ketosteroid isomerase-like protein
MAPVEAVLAFIERINQRDPEKLAQLMTEDHVFIDALGNAVTGREKMRTGWQGYYAMCPDYWISHESIFANGNEVAVFGEAGGTIAGSRWRAPAAWFAVAEDGLVKQWRVYADNKPVYDILAKAKN